jgi:hypothetical protein
MSTFNRGNFSQLWIKLTSDEPLGVIETDYLEDYYGNDGFITLRHVDTAADFQMAMVPVPEETPTIPNDIFQGVYSPLSDLPDGYYELRFRCRDVVGNYTISNSVETPAGDERIIALALELITAESVVVIGIGVVARLGISFDVQRKLEYDVGRAALSFDVSRRGLQQ